MSRKHSVRGILFCDSCLCFGLFVRISFTCCGDTVIDISVWLVLVFVDVGVWLVLVFVDVAFPSVRKMLYFPNSCNDRV
jgi:hypothetical protein